jgi:CBS-domain-containing membrane protein
MRELQKMTVKDIYMLAPMPPIIVQEGESLTRVIKKFIEFPESRGIFVVDEYRNLLGVITRRDLLDWARVKVGINIQNSKSWLAKDARLIKIIMSFSAGEIISPDSCRAAVGLDDSLAHALELMVDLDLICLPVLDDARKIIGDLKLMEILSSVVQE